MSRRIERVNSLLNREIAQILLRKIDFGDALVTITNVETKTDLTQVKILITVMSGNKDCYLPEKGLSEVQKEKEKEVISILKRNIYDIQRIVNRMLRMRPVPKIHFEIDENMKNFYKIDQLIGR